jgi:hypothetical protein
MASTPPIRRDPAAGEASTHMNSDPGLNPGPPRDKTKELVAMSDALLDQTILNILEQRLGRDRVA